VFVRVGGWQGTIISSMRVQVNPLASVCGNGIIELGEQCDGTPHCTNCIVDNLSAIPDNQCVLENEACIQDGGCDSTNAGNDGAPTACSTGCNFSPAVTVGTVYRGQISTYVNAAQDRRDSDHWLFTPPAAGTHQYAIFVNGNFNGAINFQTAAASVCGGGVAFIEGTAAWPTPGANYMVPVFQAGMTGGTQYSIRCRPGAQVGFPCSGGPWTYTFQVVGPLN
jgi:hypothetical protein